MPAHNPLDPLLQTGPQQQRELFERLSKALDGAPREDVIAAATNILINAIRQHYPTRILAERAFDELFGRAKGVLIDQHYDAFGRRKGIFPFNQVIEVPHFDFRKKQ